MISPSEVVGEGFPTAIFRVRVPRPHDQTVIKSVWLCGSAAAVDPVFSMITMLGQSAHGLIGILQYISASLIIKMSQFYGNVHFMGVARVAQGQGIVIASHAYNSEIDLNAVKQALEQSTAAMSPGKHYSFTVGSSNAWHLIAGEAVNC